MSRTFVTSDLHLGHANCAEWRGFSSVEEHNAAVIDGWNRVVRPRDTVYILGDVAVNTKHLHLVGELSGYKKLILGNHEHHDIARYLEHFSWVRGIHVWKDMAVLSHVPIHPFEMEGRWVGRVNIHGHLHEGATVGDSRYINVNTEDTGYEPVDLKSLIGYLDWRKDIELSDKQRNYILDKIRQSPVRDRRA